MIRLALAASAMALALTTVTAQADPIADRKALMKSVGAATGQGAAIAKGEAPFDAAKVKGIFQTYVDASQKMLTLYPENSKTGGDTSASPKVWEDAAGFKAAFAKFEADAAAAANSATDLASFRTAFGTVTKNCGACHEGYRVKR